VEGLFVFLFVYSESPKMHLPKFRWW
jgi:hypothetical protein